MDRKKKPSRAKLKKEYVTKNVTTRALAKKYGFGLATISKYSKEDHWVEERQIYREQIEKEKNALIESRIIAENKSDFDMAVSTQAEFQLKLYHSSDLLFNKINEILAMDVPLSPRDLKSISSTLLDLKMMRITDVNEDKKDNKMVVEFVDMEWSEA